MNVHCSGTLGHSSGSGNRDGSIGAGGCSAGKRV